MTTTLKPYTTYLSLNGYDVNISVLARSKAEAQKKCLKVADLVIHTRRLTKADLAEAEADEMPYPLTTTAEVYDEGT